MSAKVFGWTVSGLAAALLLGAAAKADVRLPTLIAPGMVLQRNAKVHIWGWADPSENVAVEFRGQVRTTEADDDGTWQVWLDPMDAGGPYELAVHGKTAHRLDNVMVGEVWVCSGQSNMATPTRNALDGAAEAERVRQHPQLRFFQVRPFVAADRPANNVPGRWQTSEVRAAASFSAAGYFFARELNTELNVPVGIIESDWGGAPCEAFTDRESLLNVPELRPYVAFADRVTADREGMAEAYRKRLAEWESKHVPPDPENGGVEQGWAELGLDDREWSATALPWPWDDWDVVKVNGVVWFRKAVEIPSAWAGKPLRLLLGTFADLDTTYFNGIQVGRTTARDTGGSWMCWRRYEIPGELVRAGRAVIAMRLAQYMGGGPVGLGCMMQLKLDGQNAISLMGPWKMKHERVLPIDRHRPSPPRGVPRHRDLPTKIYNGMIAPLTGYTIRGAIWYQGESNARRSYEYPKLLSTMIRGWRRAWGYEFPFYIAQLANYHSSEPWVELMDAQRETLDLVPQTGLAVIHDVGDPWDIHPRNKQAVGHRLALIALAKTYGKDIECSGPLYDRMALEGNRVRVFFSHVGRGLRTKDGKSLRGFLIASQDRQFIPARAEIEPARSGKETANTIRVWSDSIKNPVAVRYAWSANPDANLTNHTGLPASCFRTDDWPRMTASLRYYKQEEDGWPVP